MSYIDDVELSIRLDEEEERFMKDIYPQYRAYIQERNSRRAQNAQAAAAPAGAASVIPSVDLAKPQGSSLSTVAGMLKAATSLRTDQTSGMAAARILEETNDPNLFRVSLLTGNQIWDGLRAVTETSVEPFVGELRSFSFDQTHGNNTVVIRGEYTIGLDGKVFIPINMGRIDPSKTPIESMKQRVSVHVKIASSGDRYIYTQSYKRNGRWETKSAITNMYTQHTWPLSPNKPFWIRIVAVSEGFVTYLDGQVMCFTPHADGVPVENENLYLYFPVAGDVGEKPTWKATGVWWGASHLDHSGRRLLASTKTTVTTLSSTDLYVTGLRSDVTRADVLQAFAKFYAANVVMGPTPGSATVTINNPEMFEKALLAGASKEIIIGGIAVDVRKSTVRA